MELIVAFVEWNNLIWLRHLFKQLSGSYPNSTKYVLWGFYGDLNYEHIPDWWSVSFRILAQESQAAKSWFPAFRDQTLDSLKLNQSINMQAEANR